MSKKPYTRRLMLRTRHGKSQLCDVILAKVDWDYILMELGEKALQNKSRTAKMMHGMIVVKVREVTGNS